MKLYSIVFRFIQSLRLLSIFRLVPGVGSTRLRVVVLVDPATNKSDKYAQIAKPAGAMSRGVDNNDYSKWIFLCHP